MTSKRERPFLVIFRIGLAIQHLNLRLEKRAKVSLAQWVILQELVQSPGISPVLLASAVGIQPSTLTPALKRLQKKGFVFIEKDPKDSRKKTLSLSRKGKEAIERAENQVISWRDQIGSPSEQLVKLRDALEDLR